MTFAAYDWLSSLLKDYLILITFFLVVAICLFVRRIPGLFRAAGSGNWPTIQARVETVDVKAFAGEALGELGYSYVVSGTRYAGYYAKQFVDEQAAWDYVNPLQDAPLLVRYNPEHPDVSTLRSSEQAQQFNHQPSSLWAQFRSLLMGLRS